MGTASPTTRTATLHSKEATQFHVGEKVEYDGKLAKVIQFGFLELPTLPGQDAKFADELCTHLQLPAATPGGKPETVYFAKLDAIKSLRDDPKRQRALELEFNPYFGDPAPGAAAKYNEPEIRKPRSARAKSGPSNVREPIDMVRAAGEGQTVDTSKGTPKKAKSSKKTSSKKSAKKAK
jgi:hypothetical protein